MVRVEVFWPGTTLTALLGQSAPLRVCLEDGLPLRPAGDQRIESPQQSGLVTLVLTSDLLKETQTVVEPDRAV
jgi:hypothetical protein